MNLGLKISLAALALLGVGLATRKAAAAASSDGVPSPSPGPGPGPTPPPGPLAGQLVQTVGKHWILTNKTATSGMAANYGWHFKGASFGGLTFEPSVSLPGVRVIQGIGTKHDRFHADYSQTCVLASQSVVYQGQDRLLSDLLQDPEASKLLSVEGPLKNVRQPGVPQLEPMLTQPASGITRADVEALPDDITKREAILLAWVEQGFAEYAWSDVTTGDLTFHVFSDALMFGGVRVCVSATLQQQIADRLACSLLTARMADLAFQSAAKVLVPFPQPPGPQMASTAYMLSESDKIASALAKA